MKNRIEEIKNYLRNTERKTENLEQEIISIFKDVIQKINESSFLNGVNDKKWKADFDWLFSNDTNIWKVLEGRYDNKINIVDTKNINVMKKFLESD
jgi:hypothetical protein